MNKAQFAKRTEELLKEESQAPYRWYWCSFADDDRGGFLGAVILQAHGTVECALRARSLNANPGGQMVVIPIPAEDDEFKLPPENYRNRLLSKEDILELYPDAKSIREYEQEEAKNG